MAGIVRSHELLLPVSVPDLHDLVGVGRANRPGFAAAIDGHAKHGHRADFQAAEAGGYLGRNSDVHVIEDRNIVHNDVYQPVLLLGSHRSGKA